MNRQAGFTLIELVIVMIIISVGLVGIAALFSNTSKSLTTNEVLQQAAQYAQECAERLMTNRRANGFAEFKSDPATPTVGPAVSCGLANSTPGFTRLPNTTITDTDTGPSTTGTTTSACPNLVACRTIPITVTSTANTSLSSSITVMLVDY